MSLVELMISETISLLIISGLLLFVGPSVTAVNYVREHSEILDNGAFASTQLHESLLSAGYQGCDPSGTFNSSIDTQNENISPRLRNWAYHRFGVLGFDANQVTRIETLLGDDWQRLRYQYNHRHIGDMLAVQRPNGPALSLHVHNAARSELVFEGDLRDKLQPGQIIQLNDCSHSARLQINPQLPVIYTEAEHITTVSYDPKDSINCTSSINPSLAPSLGAETSNACAISANTESDNPFQFPSNTRAHIVNSEVFYLGYDADKSTPALKRSGFAANAQNIYTETLVEGIENLRVRFGVDTNNDGLANFYRNAAEVVQLNTDFDGNAWDNVVNLKIWLLVKSSKKPTQTSITSSLLFPSIDGAQVDCMTPASQSIEVESSHLYACPFSDTKNIGQARRVITFTIPILNHQQ